MIARIVLALFALMGFVSAEVPQFSATDDYDELNLNIRMLASHNATAGGNSTSDMKVVSVTVTMNLPVASLADVTDSMKSSMVTAFVATVGAPATTDNTVVTLELAASRRGRALQDSIKVDATFKTTVPAASAAALTSAVGTSLTATAFQAALATAGVTATVESVAAPTTSDAATPTTTTTAAPAAAAAPAASPAAPAASNAVMMGANMALVAVAALSSFF